MALPPTRTAPDIARLLAEARRLLGGEPERAGEMSRRVLAIAPGRVDATLMLGAALRRSGDAAGAVATLTPLVAAQAGGWGARFELGAALAMAGETAGAVAHLTRATELNPSSSLAWHALGDQLMIAGDRRGAERAQTREVPGAAGDGLLQEGVKALLQGDAAKADAILKGRFDLHPTDVTAMRLLADAAIRLGAHGAAETLLRPVLERAPAFMPAGAALAMILLIRRQAQDALTELDRLIAQAPGCGLFIGMRGEARAQTGDHDGALADFAAALARDPDQPRLWLSQGHALRAVGRRAEAIAAYRRSLALAPTLGEAYWSLADLKVARFEAADIAAMEAALAQEGLSDDDRAHLHYALGKALEDAGDYAPAFDHYARGAAIRRALTPYDAAAHADFIRRSRATFTPEFFAARQGVGDPAPGPIFVVGLPRSGSTLIEQILASHSAVEGLSELPDLIDMAGALGAGEDYPALLADLPREAFATLGADYLARARLYRRTDRPFFVDKAPNNFLHLGLIGLILPVARIIDARRHPMACGFSIFKQNFARGAPYSHDLRDIGRHYRDYVSLMAHFDAVLPGRVLRVTHEDLVADPEGQVRRLLAHCGLAFEDGCLRFHETARAVRTASSEQVRRPLSAQGLEHWRHFEPWLGALAKEVG